MKKQDGFGHEMPYEGETNEWITPKWIIDAFDNYAQEQLGQGCYFDLDPCANIIQPWNCARKAYTVEQDGLRQPWFGNIYCNPPYGPHTAKWVQRLSDYGNGIALIFARVETQLWQDYIFPTASGFLFPRKRIQFCRPDGTIPKNKKGHTSSSGAPSAIIAWGSENRDALIELVDSGSIPGAFLEMSFYTGSKSIYTPQDAMRAEQRKRVAESGEEPAASHHQDSLVFFEDR